MARTRSSLRDRFAIAAFIILLLPIILPIAVLVFVLYFAHRALLYLLIWLVWLPKGKDVLFVYSDSPIWHDYMTTEVMPLVKERAVVLNWSERSRWSRWSLPVHVFRSFAGEQEFNPLVVIFHPLRRARLFRFWLAFKDFKRGYKGPVERMKTEITLSL